MTLTLAFDIYGTLIDTAGVTESLKNLVGEDAAHFSDCWRQKQLEYSFRRGLMAQYADFSICTRDALSYTCQALGHPLTETAQQDLLQTYRVLPAFPDVQSALEDLKQQGHRLFAFSNGKPDDLVSLLDHAGISDAFEGIVSVHEVETFKPNPTVYRHFLEQASSSAQNSWLISSNPFDVIGAIAAELNAAWVQRSPQALFDPWGINPTITVSSLSELEQSITNTV